MYGLFITIAVVASHQECAALYPYHLGKNSAGHNQKKTG
jgi:hypothetical protein